jgi:hypothetical protein
MFIKSQDTEPPETGNVARASAREGAQRRGASHLYNAIDLIGERMQSDHADVAERLA